MSQAANQKTAIELDLESTARRAVAATIKARARAYAYNPMRLEIIFEGLSNAAPETIIAVADHLMKMAKAEKRRWWGLGGEVPLLNLKGVKLLGRILRFAQQKQKELHQNSREGISAG